MAGLVAYAKDIIMSTAIVGRWGRSLAIRLPLEVAGKLSLSEGTVVELDERENEIVVRRRESPLTLDDLFRGKSPEQWREIYRDHVVDWGPDVGREVVED